MRKPTAPIVGNLLLLAPDCARIPETFQDVVLDNGRHETLLSEMQKLRGRLYLKDGAVEPWELSPDGRHQTPADRESWHLLALDVEGSVCGCARYREHLPGEPISKLSVAASPLATSDKWEKLLFQSIAAEMELAGKLDFAFVEVGGWALTEEFRGTKEALKIALSAYSLARMLGGCIGITTATVRHSSAAILRRIGGRHLEAQGIELPSYYDPRYNCEMVLLRFNSSAPNPHYITFIEELGMRLPFSSVISAGEDTRDSKWRHAVNYQREYSLDGARQ